MWPILDFSHRTLSCINFLKICVVWWKFDVSVGLSYLVSKPSSQNDSEKYFCIEILLKRGYFWYAKISISKKWNSVRGGYSLGSVHNKNQILIIFGILIHKLGVGNTYANRRDDNNRLVKNQSRFSDRTRRNGSRQYRLTKKVVKRRVRGVQIKKKELLTEIKHLTYSVTTN